MSPIQGLYRTAHTDYRVGSATIPAGGRVLLLFGAANRDPRQYPDPARFDVERNPSDHLGGRYGSARSIRARTARYSNPANTLTLTPSNTNATPNI